MTSRLTLPTLFSLAAFALCGTMALAQQTTTPQTPPAPAATAPAPSAAPIERPMPPDPGMQPGMHPGMRPGTMRPGMMPGNGPGNMHGAEMAHHAGNMHGFHGEQGSGMGEGFRIAPAGMWWKIPAVVQRLSLTAEQTKKMDGIFEQSRLQLIDLKANLEKQNALLEPLLSANPPDTVKALAQIDKVATARAELEKADARMLLGIRGVLTPEQWTKLHAGHGAGFGGPGTGGFGAGRGPGGPGGPGASHLVTPAPQF